MTYKTRRDLISTDYEFRIQSLIFFDWQSRKKKKVNTNVPTNKKPGYSYMFQSIIKVVLFVKTVAHVCFYPKQSEDYKKKTLSPLK